MSTLMIQAEKRLREIYSIAEDSQESYYYFPSDERSYIFINNYFSINFRKFNQIKTVFDLEKFITSGTPLDVEKMTMIEFHPQRVSFICDEIIIYFMINQDISTLEVEFFNEKFIINELINNSAYDKCYDKRLSELNKLLDNNINTNEFKSMLSRDVEDIIESNIKNDNFLFVRRNDFIKQYTTFQENDIPSHFYPFIDFKIKPKIIRQTLSPFFSFYRTGQIIELISLFVFYQTLKNPELKFENIMARLYRVPHTTMDRFKKYHDLYTMVVGESEIISDNSAYDKKLYITFTTEEYFISIKQIDYQYKKSSTINGFEDIRKKIILDISDIFTKRLHILKEDITSSYLPLLTIINT